MAGIITTAIRCTVQDRKFLRQVGNDLAKGEKVYPSMLSKYDQMQRALPRTKNPIINFINWLRAFGDNLRQIGHGEYRKNNNL